MKQHMMLILVLSLLLLLTVTGCGQSDRPIPLEELPDNYSLEQAKEDGCVVHENGDVTYGGGLFEEFFRTAASGKTDQVRLAFYYTLDDSSGYDPEYYESVKNSYPCLYIQELSFDGEQYTIRWYEDGEEFIRNYSYIMKYEGPAESPDALYQSYIRYVLTNDEKVTWQELMHGMVSSRMGDYIDHMSVCTDLIYGRTTGQTEKREHFVEGCSFLVCATWTRSNG